MITLKEVAKDVGDLAIYWVLKYHAEKVDEENEKLKKEIKQLKEVLTDYQDLIENGLC